VFPSKYNYGSDYGYISYVDGGTTDEKSILKIGIENDQSGIHQDSIVLWPNNGTGYVGINTNTPAYPLDVKGNISSSESIYTNNWFRVNQKNCGLYWEQYGKGIWAADCVKASYGNVSTYGTGINGWNGYDINGRFTFMSYYDTNNDASNYCGFHDNKYTWLMYFYNNNSNNNRFCYSNLQIQAPSFKSQSDYRIKENPISLHDLPYNVDNLKPIYYKNKITNDNEMGFIAHEVQEELPFLVNGEKDGEQNQTVNYTSIIALLVKEIQDLKNENKELKKRMENLENKLNNI
jgi:hypothetical protein